MKTSIIRHNNHTILDIRKVAYSMFFWRSGDYERRLKPKKPTVHGQEIEPDEYALQHREYPAETLLERAKRLYILDKWIPVCVLVLTNGHRLEYTGDKAKAIYKKFCSKNINT